MPFLMSGSLWALFALMPWPCAESCLCVLEIQDFEKDIGTNEKGQAGSCLEEKGLVPLPGDGTMRPCMLCSPHRGAGLQHVG